MHSTPIAMYSSALPAARPLLCLLHITSRRTQYAAKHWHSGTACRAVLHHFRYMMFACEGLPLLDAAGAAYTFTELKDVCLTMKQSLREEYFLDRKYARLISSTVEDLIRDTTHITVISYVNMWLLTGAKLSAQLSSLSPPCAAPPRRCSSSSSADGGWCTRKIISYQLCNARLFVLLRTTPHPSTSNSTAGDHPQGYVAITFLSQLISFPSRDDSKP